MLDLSQEAQKELEAYFEGKDKSPIRIYLAPGGCSGPRLAMALDEPADDDILEDAGGFKFCINKDLAEQVGTVKIDMNPMGFVIDPGNPLPESSGGCGGCCAGCGH